MRTLLLTLLLTALAALVGAASALAVASATVSAPRRPALAPPPPAVVGAAPGTAIDAPPAPADVPASARAPEPLPVERPAREGPDFDVRVVDGESGARLDVPVQVSMSRTRGGGHELLARIEPPPGWTPAETSAAVLRARAPAGARSASATFVLVPAVHVNLRPNARLRGRVRDATLHLGDRALEPRGRSPLVFDVPRHVGARLTATVTTAAGRAAAATLIRAGATRIVLDVPGEGPHAAARGGAVCRGEPSAPSPATGGSAALTVRVRDRSGRGVEGARVWLDGTTPGAGLVLRNTVTNGAGEALLTELAPCAGTVTVVPPRGLPSSTPFVVREGVAETLLVREPAPTTMRVTVVDGRGRPVAFARVTPQFIGRELREGDGGDHDLTPLSDVSGVCVLRGMPPRGVEPVVRWGGASVRAEEQAPGVYVARLPLPAGD